MDWMTDIMATDVQDSARLIALRLLVAAALGLIVAIVYQGSQRKPLRESYSFVMTLVLLTILVAMTTLVIGNSVARAFSLVGALSIVRFRTVVDDTRDTAFVIYAVVVGMAAGAGIVQVYMIGVPVIAAMSLFMSLAGSRLSAAIPERRLELRIEGGIEPDTLFTEVFRSELMSYRLAAASTAKKGAAMDLQYAVRLVNPDSSLQFVRTLARLDGVQSVDLK